jgi:hypothetical protein
MLTARLLATRDPAAVRELGRLYRAARLGTLAAGRWEAIEEHARAVAGDGASPALR